MTNWIYIAALRLPTGEVHFEHTWIAAHTDTAAYLAGFGRVFPRTDGGVLINDYVVDLGQAPAASNPTGTQVAPPAGMTVEKAFAYHRPSTEATTALSTLRELFSHTKRTIESLVPASRERAVALTELETCAMWAIKALVSNDPASTVDLGTDAGPDSGHRQ